MKVVWKEGMRDEDERERVDALFESERGMILARREERREGHTKAGRHIPSPMEAADGLSQYEPNLASVKEYGVIVSGLVCREVRFPGKVPWVRTFLVPPHMPSSYQ